MLSSSHTHCCSANDIREVNQKKEYTLIATQMLQCLLTDTRLNPPTVKCWQYLYNLARFHHNLEITISYASIAKALGKSKRSVMRYIQMLIENNYLKVIGNYTEAEGRKSNTFLVRVPIYVTEKIKLSKDRQFKPTSIKEVLLEQNKPEENRKDIIVTMLEENLTAQEALNITTVFNESLNKSKSPDESIQIPILVEQKENCSHTESIEPTEVIEIINQESQANETIGIPTAIPVDEIEPVALANALHEDGMEQQVTEMTLAPSDNFVTYNNSNKKEYNNNNVVVISTENNNQNASFDLHEKSVNLKAEEKLSAMDQRLNQLKILDREEGLKLETLKGDHAATYDHLKFLGQIRSEIHQIQLDMDRIKTSIHSEQATQNKQNLLGNQIDHIFKKSGGNDFSDSAFKRLIASLKSLGFKENQLNNLVNEVVFEVKFGSLIKSYKTGKTMGADYGVNIALKLIREKRWASPTLLKSMH